MNKKVFIGNWGAFCILLNAICVKLYLNFQRSMLEVTGTSAWIMVIYISILAILGFVVILKLYSRFEGYDLLDIGGHIGGKIGRFAVGIILLAFLLFYIPLVLREFSENMKVISLNNSPISFVMLFFISGAAFSAYFGIETLSRMAGVVVSFVAITYTLILIGVAPNIDFTNILPVLGDGTGAILGKGFLKLGVYCEIIFVFLLPPFLKSFGSFRKVGIWAVGMSAFFLVTGVLMYLLSIPYKTGLEFFLPSFEMAKLINIGRFAERIESVFLISWSAAGLMFVSSGLFFITYVFRKTFNLEYRRPLVIPIAVIVFTLALLPENLVSTFMLDLDYFKNWAWIVSFVGVILLLLAARFVKKGKVKRRQNEQCE